MIKKKEFNGQYKSKLKDTLIKREIMQPKKIIKKEMTNKLKVNLSSSLKSIPKKRNSKKDSNSNSNYYSNIIMNNLQKHNTDSEKKNVILINNLINCKSCHFLAIFKDYLICDYIEEFLRRIYYLHESTERIPKLYNYYKNYLVFFCKPTFIDRFSNDKIKNYGDLNAECFYKNNFEKKKNRNDEKKYLDRKIEEKDKNKNNDKEELIKTVFTKSIQHSIDNIDEGDNNNLNINCFSNKIQQDLYINKLGNESGTLISEGNSLLLMIDEIGEKAAKKNKNISKENDSQNVENNDNKIASATTSSFKTLKNDKNKNRTNNSNINNYKLNIIKNSTYTREKYIDSIQNMVYSPKPKKNAGFSIKRDKDTENNNSEKDKRFLSPRIKAIAQNSNSNTMATTNNKNQNHNSIVVNINININTNQNNCNINNNNNFKSPIHIPKKRLPLSPFSPLNLNILNDKEIQKRGNPSSTTRNKEIEKDKNKLEEPNYIKIIKKKTEYKNIVLTSKRNKKIDDSNRIKPLNSMENNDFNSRHNFSCNNNKEILLYNKQKSPRKNNLQIDGYLNNNKDNKKILYKNHNKINNYINKDVYFSPKKLRYKQKYTNSMKDLENTENNNEMNSKKFVYHKKQNYTVNSPLNKKNRLEKKYFSYKRLDNNNFENNSLKNE
jgi:hypothetical protein